MPSPAASHLACAQEVFDIELAALQAVRAHLDDAFPQAVDLITAALRRKGKIVVIGIGKSGHVGRKIAATLTSTGSTSILLNSVDALHGDLGIVSPDDVVLALSYSGESEELLKLIPALKRLGAPILAITGAVHSSLAQLSNIVLNVKVPREACPFNLAPTSSTTATLVMGDALAMAVLQARGFRKQDFARCHPSGAIGRALLTRVREIMRSGGRNPVAHESLTVKQALLIMTQARAGCVSVTNNAGKLIGVFTDGDLRRCMASDDHLLAQPLSSVITRNPVVIHERALAVEALKIFDEKNIDDIIVINSKKQPVGLVDSQDLPKLKLM